MEQITISNNDLTKVMKFNGEISSTVKLFGKNKKRTLKNRLFSKWRTSYKTFSLSFSNMTKEVFDILEELFLTPDDISKTLIYRDNTFFVSFSDESLSFSEVYSYEKKQYLYNVTINLEEALGIKEL